MTELTNYGENEMLDHVLAVGSFTSPTNVYAKLHTGDPGEDATNNAATETTRQVMSFAAASGGTAATDADTSWTSVAATETITHISIWDAVSSGNPLCYGALDSSVPLTSGGDFTIASGDWDVIFAASVATTYLVDNFIDHLLGTASLTAPSGVWVKLHLGAPGTAATSNPAAETTRESASFSAASGGATSNSAQIQWTSVSTTETYTHYSLWDAVSGGNPLFVGAFSGSLPITAGGDLTIAATNLDVALL